MRNAKDLMGMPVVINGTREAVLHVEGFVLDSSETHVNALLVESDRWSWEARVLPLHEVQAFGETEIEVASPDDFHDVYKMPENQLLVNRNDLIPPTSLVTADGAILGTINDVLFDEDTGNVNSFEIYDESGTDPSQRISPFPSCEESQIQLYDEVEQGVIVHTSKVRQAAVQQRIAPGSAHSARDASRIEASFNNETNLGSDHAQRFIDTWMEEAAHARATAMEYLRDGVKHTLTLLNRTWKHVKCRAMGIYNKASLSIINYRVLRSLGYRVNRAVFDSTNQMIIDTGGVITRVVIERAKRAGVLMDLLRSVDRTSTKPRVTNHEQCRCEEMDDLYPPFV